MEIDSEKYCVSKQQYVILCGLEEAWFFKDSKEIIYVVVIMRLVEKNLT